jgi:hypothetical protein
MRRVAYVPIARKGAEPTIAATAATVDGPPKNGIHVLFGDIALGNRFGIGYERVVASHLALQFQLYYGWASERTIFGGDVSSRMIGAGFKPHLYLLWKAPKGLYLAPTFLTGYGTATGADGGASGLSWVAGGTLGWSIVIGPTALKIGGGMAYQNASIEARSVSGEFHAYQVRGWGVLIDGSFGFLF